MKPIISPPGRRLTWFALAWGAIGLVWALLSDVQAPAMERLYLPVLLWRFLFPEVWLIIAGLTAWMFRDLLRAGFRRAFDWLKIALRRPDYISPRSYRIGMAIVALIFASPLIGSGVRVTHDVIQFLLHRPQFYKLVVVDYYPKALKIQAREAFEAGEFARALGLMEAAAAWSRSEDIDDLKARRMITARMRYAANQHDRAVAAKRDGLAPLPISLDIDAARAYPQNPEYQRALVQDRRDLDGFIKRIGETLRYCKTSGFSPVQAGDVIALDSFAPGAIDNNSKPARLDCAKLPPVCQGAVGLCLNAVKKHLQMDRLAAACEILVDREGEDSGPAC